MKNFLSRLIRDVQSTPKDSGETSNPRTRKIERFTAAARNVLNLAQAEAERLGHGEVAPEHLLVGLIQQEGYAQQFATQMNIELSLVVAQIEQLTASIPKVKSVTDLTGETKKVLELAVDETRRLDFQQITTHQLMIAILRHNNNLAVRCLQEMKFDTANLLAESRQHMRALIRKMGHKKYSDFENTLPPK